MQITAETGNKVFDFIQNNRKGIFTVLGIFVAVLVGMVVFFMARDNYRRNAIAKVEELNERFIELRFFFEDPYYEDEINYLLADLGEFAKGSRGGYAAGRAWSIKGQIHSARRDWALAEEAWRTAARVAPRTHMAPAAFFNAAVTAEEQGNIKAAIELFEKSVSHPFSFPAAPRAQFNIGRLYEQQGDYPAAMEAYREILRNWSFIEIWSNLAQSRLTAIEAR